MIPVLDHGYVMLVGTMGDDQAIVDAARVSYGNGTSHTRNTRGLIRYLMRHRHSSPFEMCEIKLEIQAPMFVARQWMRHRTASVNEYSGRYSEMLEEMYTPEDHRFVHQSRSNKQGSSDEQVPNLAYHKESMQRANQQARSIYNMLIEGQVARETARAALNLNQYTKWVWKIDLHNLLHFLNLRLGKDAQWEIRQYAEAIASIVKEWVPTAWEAFEDYWLYSETFSRPVMNVLRGKAHLTGLPDEAPEGVGDREWLTVKTALGL